MVSYYSFGNITDSEYSGSIEIENSAGTVNIEIKQKKSANPKFAKGRGTEKSPWVICTPAQLNEVRNYTTGYFEVANDIDLTPYLKADGTGWKPIEVFNGHFDGKKHVIKGLWISLSSVSCIGLFAKWMVINQKFQMFMLYWIHEVFVEMVMLGVFADMQIWELLKDAVLREKLKVLIA